MIISYTDMKEIPVLLLTGYLGSGKTTLVNKILSNRRGIKFAVIVNDIGEVNIDADLIQKGGVVGKKDDSLVALQNGCICCTLKMDLVQQLSEIAAMKRFDYIVIEASGICEPEPIAQTICTIPQMGPEYVKDGMPRLDCVATVVDALRMRDEFGSGDFLLRQAIEEDDLENLIIQQVEFCNLIILNKASEVSEQDKARIKEIIRALQPKAEIIECDFGDVDLDRLINTGLFNFEAVATSATWVSKVEGALTEEDTAIDDDDDDDDYDHHHHEHEHHHHEHEHEHHHHHHDHDHEGGEVEEYNIGTYVYYQREPFDISLFDHFVAKKMTRNIIRVKGLCYFSDQPHICYLFEQAGKQVSLKNAGQWYATMPENLLEKTLAEDPILQRDWDPVYGDRMQKLVFIGQNLDKALIKSQLDACLYKG